MMMAPPQVVGVLLKKPGQLNNPRALPFDPQETKIRGELYVEDLNERRIVSIRMGWLWVENTQMRLPLRALNLRQAAPSICQPHVLALGFTLTNSQGDLLATFWADTEPIYWSWVRAIAAELVRQTPFRAQRCLNFLEILTICPRGPLPLPDSPTETRRRSRSELRCWLGSTTLSSEISVRDTAAILDTSRRRARSELRGWSSSNSSDEDLHLVEYRGMQSAMLPKVVTTFDARLWGCSESSEGSDDSLPWGGIGCRSSVDSIDSPSIPEPVDTREQRIQRYKEARRRENEARSRRVLEEDAKRRKARREENNNDNDAKTSSRMESRPNAAEKRLESSQHKEETTRRLEGSRNNLETTSSTEMRMDATRKSMTSCQRTKSSSPNVPTVATLPQDPGNNRRTTRTPKTTTPSTDPFVRAAETVDAITRRLPPLKVSDTVVRFKETNQGHREDNRNNNVSARPRNNNNSDRVSNNNNSNNNNNNLETSGRYKVESPPSPGITRTDSGERRSRARERRNIRDRCQISLLHSKSSEPEKTDFSQGREPSQGLLGPGSHLDDDEGAKAIVDSRLDENASRKEFFRVEKECRERDAISLPRMIPMLSIHDEKLSSTCEEDVAKLLARCQRVDHYVPVREKLTLFESLSRLGGRLARSTEDLGRSSTKPSPRGKQRARSLHDLNRPTRSVPVREMCRFFEGDKLNEKNTIFMTNATNPSPNKSSSVSTNPGSKKDQAAILKNHQDAPPCVRTSSRKKHYQK